MAEKFGVRLKSASNDHHKYSSDPERAWSLLKNNFTQIQPLSSNQPVPENALRFVCMSDTHSRQYKIKFPIPDGDVLLHAGDITMIGTDAEIRDFNTYLGTLPHKYKVVIAGNHDFCLSATDYNNYYGSSSCQTNGKKHENASKYLTNCIYLEDSSTEICGISIYGSPWIPRYGSWSFSLDRGNPLLEKWNKIPENTDIVLTHSPPVGYGDVTVSNYHVGCVDLLCEIQQRIRPKYHVFGHIHEGYGQYSDGNTTFINCSTCNVKYQPVNKPLIFDIMRKDT